MAMLDKNWEPFDLLCGARTSDGRSGAHTVWSVAGEFSACAVIGQALHDRARANNVTQAQEEIPKPLYTILARRSVLLPFHAVVRRQSDGRIFRLKNDAADAQTPKGARLDLRMYAAEEYRLPDGDSWKPEPAETEGGGNDQSASDS